MFALSVLGSRIKYLREKKNLSQKRLADSLGITNVQLSRYESGDRKPDPETILQIADYFETTTDYLLGKTNNPHQNNEGLAFLDGTISEDEIEYLEKSLKEFRELKAKFLRDKEKK